jgi:hypothetical protein
VACLCLLATAGQSRFTTLDKTAKRTINVDGRIDSLEWKGISMLEPLINKWPVDSGVALQQSNIRIAYDDQFIYISAINYQDAEQTIVQTLQRDNPQGYWGSDALAVVLDPLGLQSSGFMFGVTAGGAQMEASVSQGSQRTQLDRNWDNKWYSVVTRSEKYWTVEMAIPFKTLRFNASSKEWRLNFVRNDMYNNVYSSWSQVPIAFGGIDLGYTGTLRWEEPPAPNKKNIAMIPYVAGQVLNDYSNEENTEKLLVGMDAKVALTSSLNLDLTVNPDFSNVAVDQQQTNLTQFSLFFPEQRPFFLENSDLFSNYGTWGVNPFFSRRIGLNDGSTVPISFGARVSGNLTKKLRIGIMDVQTRSTGELTANNYFVSSFQHQVLSRSRIKLLLANREQMTASESNNATDYGRSGGAEFDYISKGGELQATAKYHIATNQEISNENAYMTLGTSYNNGKVFGAFYYNRVEKNYQPDLGFVPSLFHYDSENDTTLSIGFQRINTWLGYIHRPKTGNINSMEFNPWIVSQRTIDGENMQTDMGFWYAVNFKSRHSFELNLMQSLVSTQVPLNFTGEGEPIPLGNYRNSIYRAIWSSDSRKTISGSLSVGYGNFFSGERLEWMSNVNIRKSPWGNFGVRYNLNRLMLGDRYGDTLLHLIGPTASISFTNALFWTTFLQYNTQANNFNVNSRLQWRFKPMSDLFIVYRENYDTMGLNIQNRSLVMKLTYWFNL